MATTATATQGQGARRRRSATVNVGHATRTVAHPAPNQWDPNAGPGPLPPMPARPPRRRPVAAPRRPLKHIIWDMHDDAVALLRDGRFMPAFVLDVFDTMEQYDIIGTEIEYDRSFVAYLLLGIYVLYMMFGHFAELVTHVIGVAYPAYASFKAIGTEEKEDDTEWLTYWCVFGVYACCDFAAEPIMAVLPLYWLVKCAFLYWLYSERSKGAEQVYNGLVEPMFDAIERRYTGLPHPVAQRATTTAATAATAR